MTMRIYTSSDTSAPALEGVVGGALSGGAFATGSWLEVLRQILVAGYGSQTAAGWTMPFTATSRASFKQGSGCGFYLDVLDDGSLTAGAREAQCFGYEVMTAAATGTGQFPTVAQQATGIKFRKAESAASTPVIPWICYADSSTFYFFSVPQFPSGTLYYAGFAFGNFHSLVPSDAYNCMIIGRVTSAVIDATGNESLDQCESGNFVTTRTSGHYLARGYGQSGASLNWPKYLNSGPLGNNGPLVNGNIAPTGNPFPNPGDNTLILCRMQVIDADTPPVGGLRGWLKGMYGLTMDGSKIPMQAYTGTGNLSGRSFRILGLRTGGAANGRYVLETSDTWDS